MSQRPLSQIEYNTRQELSQRHVFNITSHRVDLETQRPQDVARTAALPPNLGQNGLEAHGEPVANAKDVVADESKEGNHRLTDLPLRQNFSWKLEKQWEKTRKTMT